METINGNAATNKTRAARISNERFKGASRYEVSFKHLLNLREP
jgi:hypothetical protein